MTNYSLRNIELQQKAILDNIPDMAWLKDNQSRFIMVNERFAKSCGFKVEELIGKTDLDIWPKDLAESYRADDQDVINSRKRKIVEERLADKEGKIQWIETIKTPIFDDQGIVIGTTGIARDITLRKKEDEKIRDIRAELELRVKVRTAELTSLNEELRKEVLEHKQTEKEVIKFKLISDSLSDPVYLVDREGKFSYVNKAACLATGYNQEELLTLSIMQIDPIYDKNIYQELFDQVQKKRVAPFESINERKDGSSYPVEISSTGVVLNGQPYLFALVRDISERKKSENIILEMISLLSATIEATVDGILVVDAKGKVAAYNDKFLQLWRIPDDLIKTKDDNVLLSFVVDQLENPDEFLKKVEYLYSNNKEVSFDTIRFKDGRIFDRYSQPQKINNEIVGRVWSFRDVTESRKTERELQGMREKLENLVDQRTELLKLEIETRKAAEQKAASLNKQIEFILGATRTGLDIIGKEYNIIYVDPAWAKTYGDWHNKKCFKYFKDRDNPCPECSIEESLRTKKAVISEEIMPKEENRLNQVTNIPFQNENGEWQVARVHVDISEKKKVEQELRNYRDSLEKLVEERTQELLQETIRYKNSELDKNKLNTELIKINERLKSVSLIDPHTGLYNYRYLQEVIEAEFHQARRYAQNLSIILLDIDYFKSINDVYGMAFGDLVLKQFAKQLKRMVRRYDILIRYSGEEFIIISPRLDRDVTLSMAQRLLDSLNFINFGNRKHSVKLKLSLSVVSFPEDRAKNGMELVNLSNKILTQVKESGGNRVYTSVDIKSPLKKGIEKVSKVIRVKALEKTIDKLHRQSKQGLTESIFAFAKTLELKDHYTGEHVENTVHFATEIAKGLNLSKEEVELIKQAAMLHDLGKIGISESILLKKGKLNKKEFEEIKKHAQIGADIIRPIRFLHGLIPFIFYHHERWDGRGYPSGIKGEDIPLGARIIAIADVYQALTSDRPYHKAFSKEEAIDIIKKASGTQFDPRIVNTFLQIIEKKS